MLQGTKGARLSWREVLLSCRDREVEGLRGFRAPAFQSFGFRFFLFFCVLRAPFRVCMKRREKPILGRQVLKAVDYPSE